MKRGILLVWLVVAVGTAAAGPTGSVRVDVAPPRATAEATSVLYLNRCSGGCTIHGAGIDDATSHTSSLPCNGGANCQTGACFCMDHSAADYTIHEFVNEMNQTGSAADAEWAAIVKCVKEVYSPYAVTVTDVKPTGVTYNEAIIAGEAIDIGWPNNQVGGIAHVPSDCSFQNNIISYSFANEFLFPGRDLTICAVAAQETAHSYGLEHEYAFIDDGMSACKDPMSYRSDCGGQKFFRNQPASCGEFAVRPCSCGGAQNSHHKILTALGPGTPITTPPHVEILTPANGATVADGAAVQVTAGAQRGVARVELWLNNYKWTEANGAPFGANGQQDPSSYPLVFPSNVPDGVIDIVVKAFDDIEVETDAAKITVTKGAPCADATTCAKGQKCDAGKCFWDAPTGMLGDACTYPQFCTSGVCSGTADTQICTQPCLVGVAGACPDTYDCIMTDGTQGICFPASTGGGGCCSVSGEGDAIWIHLGLGAAVLGLVMRRRRR